MMKIRVVKSLFFMLLIIVSGYYLLTEYQYYHQSSTVFGTVVNTRTVSSAERRLADACTTFHGREDCSALFEYDITWRSGGQAVRRSLLPLSRCKGLVSARRQTLYEYRAGKTRYCQTM